MRYGSPPPPPLDIRRGDHTNQWSAVQCFTPWSRQPAKISSMELYSHHLWINPLCKQTGQIHIFHQCTQFSNMNKPGFVFKLNEYMIKTLIRPSTNWLSELCPSEYTIICLKIYLSPRDPPATCVELLVIHPQHPRDPPETCTKRKMVHLIIIHNFWQIFLCDNATDIIYKKLTNNNRKYRNIMSKNVDFQTYDWISDLCSVILYINES